MNEIRDFEQEREIDLVDMLGRIISKWRRVIVIGCMGLLLGIVVACILGFVKFKENDIEAQKEVSQKGLSEALADLLEEEKGKELKETAERQYDTYVSIQSLYDIQTESLTKSIYNNMDASHITNVILSYYVDNHYVNEYPIVNGYNNINDIISAYGAKLLSDKVCGDIAIILGVETEPRYIKEIISVSNPSTSSLTITIMTDDAVLSEKIAEYYKGIMGSVTEELILDYGDFTTSLMQEQEYTESSIDVLNKQNEAKSKFTTYDSQIQSIEKSMSGAQLDYYKALVKNYKLENMEAQEDQGFLSYISKKMIALIALGAVAVAVVIYGAGYVLDGAVKTGEELASMSCSMLLGTVLVDADKKRKHILFDKWAVALTDERVLCDDADRTVQAISETVVQYLSNNNLKSVLFAGADIKHTDVLDKLTDLLKTSGIKINTAMDAFDSPDTISDITASDMIVLVGEVGSSKYKKLDRVLAMCRLYKKEIVGAVALQERV